MTQTQFSLSWKSFKNNFCGGLAYLQQHEEFVDMTLAADGHFVKVHQIVLSLASPYLKELITSAPCRHPVLFLNHISYQTLCSLLEYVYSGEVLINKENLKEVLQAGRALHIKGLDVMEFDTNDTVSEQARLKIDHKKVKQSLSDKLPQYSMATKSKALKGSFDRVQIQNIQSVSGDKALINDEVSDRDDDINMSNMDDTFKASDIYNDFVHALKSNKEPDRGIMQKKTSKEDNTNLSSKQTIQYTLSNQGNIQMILNRYIYYLRYNYKKTNPAIRLWRCVEYLRNRCPATVTTNDDIVVQRVAAHKHPFHDKKILKKVRTGHIFTAIKDAEGIGSTMGSMKDTSDAEDPMPDKKTVEKKTHSDL